MNDQFLLKMENIKKRYGHVEALKGVDLGLKKGEVLGLVGENGAGKAINHKEADRVPIDVGGTLATSLHRIIYHKLKEKFNIRDDKEEILELALQSVVLDEKVLKKLHGDVVGLYSKPPKSWKMNINPEDNSYIDEWGIKYRATRDNLYFDIVDHALKEVTTEKLEEVFQIAARIAIPINSKIVGTIEGSEVGVNKAVTKMVDREH